MKEGEADRLEGMVERMELKGEMEQVKLGWIGHSVIARE